MNRLVRTFIGSLVLLGWAVSATATEAPVVAVGDVHGNFDGLAAILQEAGVIDGGRRWVGGGSTLVQTGDFLDRGASVREVMDLLMALEEEAPARGGRVVILLGNHEALNLQAAVRDVNPEAYAAFADAESEARQRAAWKAHVRLERARARDLGQPQPAFSRRMREEWKAAHPLGFVEYQEALGPQGRYGRWLRTLPAVAKVGDCLFVHGGISPVMAGQSVEALNERVWSDIERFDGYREGLLEQGLILPFSTAQDIVGAAFAHLRIRREAIAKAGEEPGENERVELARLEEFVEAPSGVLDDPDGPLWFRGYAHWSEEEGSRQLGELLASYRVSQIVAAHTPQKAGRISARFGGTVFLIDTGMLSAYYTGGRASALEIRDGSFTAVYLQGREVLLDRSSTPATCEVARPRGFARPPQAALASLAAIAAGPAASRWPGPGGDPPPFEGAGSGGSRWVGPDGDPLPFANDDEVLEFLSTATVVSSKEIGTGVTRPLRLVLERDGVRMRAAFRYGETERSEVRLMGRTWRDFRDSFVFEKAAYELARLLGLDRVPPTVLRTFEGKPKSPDMLHLGKKGSVQAWIEDAMMEKTRLEKGLRAPDPLRWRRETQIMRIFDALIFNLDRTEENIIYGPDWRLWLIDHTRAFRPEADLRDADKIFLCERGLWEKLSTVGDADIRERLDPYLSHYQITGLLKRRKKLVSRIEVLIDLRGEEAVLFTLD